MQPFRRADWIGRYNDVTRLASPFSQTIGNHQRNRNLKLCDLWLCEILMRCSAPM